MIRPTVVHHKFLILHIKLQWLFGNIGPIFLHHGRPVTRNVGEKSNYVTYTNSSHISLPTTKTGKQTQLYNSKWTKISSKNYLTNNYNAKYYYVKTAPVKFTYLNIRRPDSVRYAPKYHVVTNFWNPKSVKCTKSAAPKVRIVEIKAASVLKIINRAFILGVH
jgi:hypothetical protein